MKFTVQHAIYVTFTWITIYFALVHCVNEKCSLYECNNNTHQMQWPIIPETQTIYQNLYICNIFIWFTMGFDVVH